jgi:hypothetical protein
VGKGRPPGSDIVDTLTGQPARGVPSSMLNAWISWRWISPGPIAPAAYSVRVAGSITGVLMMPMGCIVPHGTPVVSGAAPMLRCHTMAPVVSSSA